MQANILQNDVIILCKYCAINFTNIVKKNFVPRMFQTWSQTAYAEEKKSNFI